MNPYATLGIAAELDEKLEASTAHKLITSFELKPFLEKIKAKFIEMSNSLSKRIGWEKLSPRELRERAAEIENHHCENWQQFEERTKTFPKPSQTHENARRRDLWER